MKEIIVRATISIIVGIVTCFIGEAQATTDVEYGLAYVAGVIAGGCFWIGSRK